MSSHVKPLNSFSIQFVFHGSQVSWLIGVIYGQALGACPEIKRKTMNLQMTLPKNLWRTTCAELGVIVISSYLSVWAPSLALRGKRGATDLHKACDTLRDYQALVFTCFMCGWVIYFIASVLQVWIFYRKSVATFVSIPFSIFTLAIIWYLLDLRWKLSLPEDQVVSGKIAHFQRYENIGDITDGLSSSSMPRRSAGGTAGDYFAVDQEEDEPKILVSGRTTQRSS